MPLNAVNIVNVLRRTRQEANRNANVLDHISTPHHLPSHNIPNTPPAQQQQQQQPSPSPSRNKQVHQNHHSNQTNTQQQQHPPQNGKTSTSKSEHPSPSPPSPHPISKYVLSSLFAAVDKLAARSPDEKRPNYVFIDNDKEHNFLYGLVLPLIARLFAVSCPGILCIVQLPRYERQPEFTPPPYSGFGSNGSNGSKSFSHTTPSPQNTSRTASPSDEELGGANRKSISPDSNPGTAELIRHADKVLSRAEAAAEKRAAEARASEESSPPPDAFIPDHGTLRLICNGFEVLTGKMPPPKCNMGPFTMASVGWEKAGVVSPETSSKGVTMSFSNGMMVPTEGIVVTFSNGSMCFLTVTDPLSAVESLNISDATPVVVFTFMCPGQVSLGSLLCQDSSSLPSETERKRAACGRANIIFVEFGDAGGISINETSAQQEILESAQENAASHDVRTTKDSSISKANNQTSSDQGTTPRYPQVSVSAVPRAVPLFVNTINQTFIDGPYEIPESAYEHELINDRYKETRNDLDLRRSHQNLETGDSADARKTPQENGCTPTSSRAPISSQAPESTHPLPSDTPGQRGAGIPSPSRNAHIPSTTAGPAAVSDKPLEQVAGPSLTNQGPTAGTVPVVSSSEATHDQRQSAYSYYGFETDPSYSRNTSQQHSVHASRRIPGPPVALPQGQGGSQQAYYHAMPAPVPPPTGRGHYQHQPPPCYPTQQYYSLPTANMMHQVHHNGAQWHHGIPAMSHRPSQLPPPYPMDARRDMPVHFSSHSAVASVHGQFASHNYSRIVQSRRSYEAAQNCVAHGSPARGPNDHVHPMPETPNRNDPANFPLSQKRTIPLDDSSSKDIAASAVVHSAHSIPATNATADLGERGAAKTETRGGSFGYSPSQNEQQATDKENALRALIEMRTGVQCGDVGKRQEKRRRSAVGLGAQHGAGVEHSTRGRSSENPNISSEACNVEGSIVATPSAALRPPGMGRFANLSRSRLSTGTNSSTSTNSHSQGQALMPGTLIGNSHNPGRSGFGGSKRPKKRPRQN